MKSLIPAIAIAAGGLLGLASFGAQASDGTITFTGTLSDTTCSINGIASGTPVTSAVTLPEVSASTLGVAGATAGRSAPIPLELTGCSGTATKAVAYFESSPNVDQANGYLTNTGGTAKNVDVRLLNASFQPINILTAENNHIAANGATISAGAASLKYYGEYFATGAATAGTVNTSVSYTMQYQ
ncbi:fimbrial protein [Paraburkholderia sp. DHOC27]|uniref:fimbrial protein n=1 Tax=Paraburkholderia sp. DHOC27 TaxID=2303330 RepID=UPI000E3C22E1|nr:fimbrial protein [Paraburkholderia sp. DHOC27]RFU48726.1 type 1 fimbrial protein [Paraburkholderia sp. DHOC27]